MIIGWSWISSSTQRFSEDVKAVNHSIVSMNIVYTNSRSYQRKGQFCFDSGQKKTHTFWPWIWAFQGIALPKGSKYHVKKCVCVTGPTKLSRMCLWKTHDAVDTSQIWINQLVGGEKIAQTYHRQSPLLRLLGVIVIVIWLAVLWNLNHNARNRWHTHRWALNIKHKTPLFICKINYFRYFNCRKQI